jgi:hypothetical protein
MLDRPRNAGSDEVGRWRSRLGRVVHVVEAVACLVLATWFAWSIADEDAIPTVLAAASTVAAVIVVADIGVRLLRTPSKHNSRK